MGQELGDVAEHLAKIDDQPEHRIHESRKGLKRARALLALLAPALPEADLARETDACKDAARRLAEARDAAVLVSAFEAEVESSGLPVEGIAAPRQFLAERREAQRTSSEDLSEALALVQEAIARIPEWTARLGSWDELANGFAKTYRKARRRMKKARRGGEGELFHDWRKFAKYHLYQAQMLQALGLLAPKRVERLDALADNLGGAHDLLVLSETLSDAGHLTPELDEWLGERREKLERKALDKGTRLFSKRPGSVRKASLSALSAAGLRAP